MNNHNFLKSTTKLLDNNIDNILRSIDMANDSLEIVAQNFGYTSKEYSEAIEKVMQTLPLRNIRQRHITAYMNIPPAYSYVAEQVRYMRFKQQLEQIDIHISPWKNDKFIDQKFARSLNIPTPEVLQSKVPLAEIIFEDNIVLKPYFGSSSRFVYYYINEENIIEVKNSANVNNLKALKESLSNLDIEDSWQTEVLVCNIDNKPANDIKVYCYYGKVGCVLEIKRSNKAYQCWYDKDGNILENERRNQPWFEGTSFDNKVLEYAKKISLAIPAPFMRIDFYKGKEEYYLGELTPHPGRYFPEYSPELDYHLGELFCQAEARLFKDLIHKKSFESYLAYYGI